MLCLEPKHTLVDYIQCMPDELLTILFEDVFTISDLVTQEFNYPVAKALIDKFDNPQILAPIYNPLKFTYASAAELAILLYHIEYLGLHVENITKYLRPNIVDDIIDGNITQTYLHKLAAVIVSSDMGLDYYLKERVTNLLVIDDCYFCRQLFHDCV